MGAADSSPLLTPLLPWLHAWKIQLDNMANSCILLPRLPPPTSQNCCHSQYLAQLRRTIHAAKWMGLALSQFHCCELTTNKETHWKWTQHSSQINILQQYGGWQISIIMTTIIILTKFIGCQTQSYRGVEMTGQRQKITNNTWHRIQQLGLFYVLHKPSSNFHFPGKDASNVCIYAKYI